DSGVEEPIELLIVDTPEESAGKVIELVGQRRGEMVSMTDRGGRPRIEFKIPSRGLIGIRTRLLNLTRGEAVINHRFLEYGPWRGEVPTRNSGVMVSMVQGTTNNYALFTLKDRGAMFVPSGTEVYMGMIVGEHCKENDIIVNTTRKKQLTNMRASGSDDKLMVAPPRLMSLEEALEYIATDELVEITPTSIRLRKKLLHEKDRKRAKM
ncbi:MAG: translational GTPase TypA, partial [Planctomycetota bacterium]